MGEYINIDYKSEGSQKNSSRSVGDFALDCCSSIEWEL